MGRDKSSYHYELLTHIPEIAGFLSAILLSQGRDTTWDNVISLKKVLLAKVSWEGGLVHWLIEQDYLYSDKTDTVEINGGWKKLYVTDKALELMEGQNEH
jgi:hypothetical protein